MLGYLDPDAFSSNKVSDGYPEHHTEKTGWIRYMLLETIWLMIIHWTLPLYWCQWMLDSLCFCFNSLLIWYFRVTRLGSSTGVFVLTNPRSLLSFSGGIISITLPLVAIFTTVPSINPNSSLIFLGIVTLPPCSIFSFPQLIVPEPVISLSRQRNPFVLCNQSILVFTPLFLLNVLGFGLVKYGNICLLLDLFFCFRF